VLVSVIIPALNEAENIEQCVDAARRCYAPSDVEIIVVDGGSTDGTLARVPSHATCLQSHRGRAAQMNHGAQLAHGKILVFCHADAALPDGWREAVIGALRQPGVSGGAFQIAYRPAKGILHWTNRHILKGDWIWVHGDRAQFMSRATFDEIGGFPDIPLMEDVEMARALHQRGRIVMLPHRITASSRRYLERGPLFQYSLSIWLMFRYLVLNATPEDIARAYRSSRELATVKQSQATSKRHSYERNPKSHT
jgi:rSAM/selenodomain-associated transferase 2